MAEHTPRNLPLLEQMAIHIPGYGGYLDRGNRRAADRALRDAIAHRLSQARARLDEAIRQCLARDAADSLPEDPGRGAEGHRLLTEVSSLERVRVHLDRVINMVRSTGSGTDAFYGSGNLDLPKADALHAFDLALFHRAEELLRRFDAPNLRHNFLADLESDLMQFEQKLDERALLLQGIQ